MTDNTMAKQKDDLEKLLNEVEKDLTKLDQQLRPLAEQKAALLKQKLDYLDEVLGQRRSVIEELEALQDLYPNLEIGLPFSRIITSSLEEAIPRSAKRRHLGEYSDMKVWEAAREVLRKAGRPLFTRQIAEEVVAGGKPISEPISSKLNSNIRQKPDIFVSETQKGKSVWRLREWNEKNRG